MKVNFNGIWVLNTNVKFLRVCKIIQPECAGPTSSYANCTSAKSQTVPADLAIHRPLVKFRLAVDFIPRQLPPAFQSVRLGEIRKVQAALQANFQGAGALDASLQRH